MKNEELVQKIMAYKQIVEAFETLIGSHKTIINEEEAIAYVKAKNNLLFGKVEVIEEEIKVLQNCISDCK